MVPAFFTRLEAIPLNSNGKVDRFALPRPDANARTRPYAAPETPEEAAICQAFGQVLQVERFGANDDFFELGGDSLSTALGSVQVDYRDIYAWRTPRQIAARLSEKDKMDLDALEAVFSNYALFSTVLSHEETGVPVFRYVPGKIVHPEIHEVEAHTGDTLAALIRPYRLNGELLYRCAIYATKEHVFLDWDTSHIISDGTSMANFMSELFAAYRGEPLRRDHYYWYLENQYRRRMALEHEADALLLTRRFDREDYRRNPEPDLTSRRTGNGQHISATTLTVGQLQSGCAALGTRRTRWPITPAPPAPPAPPR